MPPVDHNEIDYIKFEKNFYDEHGDITKMTHKDVVELRKSLGIKVRALYVRTYVRICCVFVHVYLPHVTDDVEMTFFRVLYIHAIEN